MKILVINAGSSSLKYQLFNMDNQGIMAKGLVERIGLPGALLNHTPGSGEKKVIEAEIPNHKVGIKLVLDSLVHPEYGVMEDLSEINAVGHRVVHGGEKFADSVLINEEVKQTLQDCIELAPLHNPPNIIGIKAFEELLPGVPQVGVFDTAFHQTMPKYAYLYGLPYELYEKYGIRRYGFHGTSHKYVAQRAAALLRKPLDNLKLITCHLGNGASISAVNRGKSVENSMGFTPLEGLMMGTRCGDIDPAIVSFIMEKENMTTEEVNHLMNKKSGVLGISGLSSDFRDLEQAADQGNEMAKLALDMFAYNVKKYIGSYAAVLNGVDAIVFTAGLGENSALMRAKICEGLDYLGIAIDPEKNNTRGKEIDISKDEASTRVLVIPTNEELMIAKETQRILANS